MARVVILLLTVIATVFLLLVSNVPLGVPDEWVWRRQQLPENLIEALDRLAIPGIVGVIVVAFAQFVDRRIDRSSTIKRVMFVSLLVVGAFSWLNAARQAAATPHRELRPLWVLKCHRKWKASSEVAQISAEFDSLHSSQDNRKSNG